MKGCAFLLKASTCLLIILSLACSQTSEMADTSVSSGDTYGTTVNNPRKLETENIFPHFKEYLPSNVLAHRTDPSAAEPVGEWATLWVHLLDGPGIQAVQMEKLRLHIFGQKFAQAAEAVEAAAATDSLQSLDLLENTLLADTLVPWTVQYKQELSHAEYTRYFMLNPETNLLQASYLMVPDSEGNPIRGILVSVDPRNMSLDAADRIAGGDGKSTVRMIALAYDFTDPENNQMVVRFEYYNKNEGHFATFHVHQQCNLTTNDCIGELIQNTEAPPAVDISPAPVRYSWNENTKVTCMGRYSYETGSAVLLDETHGFTGLVLSDDEMTTGCTIPTPTWGSGAYPATFLPLRLEDDSLLATSIKYFGDGTSLTPWEQMTVEDIDNWLKALTFEN